MLNYTYKLQRHQDTKLMAQLATANQLQKKNHHGERVKRRSWGGAREGEREGKGGGGREEGN